jgi:hypothetical protein
MDNLRHHFLLPVDGAADGGRRRRLSGARAHAVAATAGGVGNARGRRPGEGSQPRREAAAGCVTESGRAFCGAGRMMGRTRRQPRRPRWHRDGA